MSEADGLNIKLVEWFQRPEIQAKRWSPALFWRPNEEGPFGALKVDGRELEVLFAAILGEPSEYQAILDREDNGRGTFLAANARRHELPLLSRVRADQA
ncbi:MAG TPA: hypothetical protein VKA50_00070 [Gammaproteobacteria bacterium]|nr:hypothetical protein [Gammaproteobacteria bacterium]